MATETKLFIGNLPLDIREDELRDVFSTYGKVLGVRIMRPAEGARWSARRNQKKAASNPTCATLRYEHHQACKDAIEVLDNSYRIREDAREPIHVSFALAPR